MQGKSSPSTPVLQRVMYAKLLQREGYKKIKIF